MIEFGLLALAIADPTVSGLIGNRFYPFNLPEMSGDALPVTPAVTYRLVSTTDLNTLKGPVGCVQVRIQLDSWGATYTDARALTDALRTLLNGYTGTLPNGVVVQNIWRDSEESGFDEYVRLPYVQTDWMIIYTE